MVIRLCYDGGLIFLPLNIFAEKLRPVCSEPKYIDIYHSSEVNSENRLQKMVEKVIILQDSRNFCL